MTFATPLFLYALPSVFLLLLVAALLRHSRAQRLDKLISASARARIQLARVPSLPRLRQLLAGVGLLLIAFALARPQWGFSWRDARREGLDLIIAIDTSNSMRADDFKPSRLQRAKWGVEELVGSLTGDRVGLVAFAGEAQLLCPLTLDHAAFMMHLQDIFPGIVPRGGTDLSAALRKAVDSFGEQREADRVILLITDGESHSGDLEPVLKEIVAADIRVFAIGVGTPDGSLIPTEDGAFLRNRGQEVVKSSLDETVLRRIASRTGGLYVRADPRDFGATQILEKGLAPLKRAQLESTRVQQREERFQIFLGLGLFFLFLEAFARVPGLLTRRPSA
jgi:Ca-activated chloride channel family protein